MATDLERLIVNLEANITKYERTMARANAVTDQRARQMEQRWRVAGLRVDQSLGRAFSKFGGYAGATIASTLSITAAINGTRAALEKFGAIADRSAASGLDPELYQALQYQLSLVGVSAEQTGSSLAAFAKASGLAGEDTGRLAAQLEKLDPELLQAIQSATTQEQRVKAVADALARVEDPAKRAAIATAAFGEAGSKIALAFAGGSAEIDAMAQKARDLGIVVSRELIDRADTLGDEFDTITQVIDTQLKAALIDLGPHLVYLLGLVGDFAKSLAIVLDQFRGIEDRQFLNPLQNQLAGVLNHRFFILDEIKRLEDQLSTGGDIIPDFIQEHALASARTEMERLTDEALKLQDRIAQLQGMGRTPPPALPGDRTAPPPGGGGGGSIVPALAPVDAGVAKITDSMRELDNVSQEALTTLGGELSNVIKALVRGEDAVAAMGDALGNVRDKLIDMAVNSLVQAAVGSLGSSLGRSLGATGFARGTANTGGTRGQARGIVHGQEAVIPLPSGGRVPVELRMPRLPVAGRQQAVGVAEVRVTFDEDAGFRAFVTKTATRISAAGDARQAQTMKRALPGWQNELNTNGVIG